MAGHTTGCVIVRRGRRADVYYAKVRPDGGTTQKMIRLGRVWTKRTRPPDGYLTAGQAQGRLEAILHGDDPLVNLAPLEAIVTFKQACDEWLRYIEDDKKRARSTVRDYRNVVNSDLLPHFGEDTPIVDITTADGEALREALLGRKNRRRNDEKLSHRTVQKVMVLLHGIFARAKRKGWVAVNVVENVERVTVSYTGEFNVLEPEQVAAISRAAETDLLGAVFTVGAFTGLRCPGELRALRWAHVDFANRIVHVRRNFVEGVEGATKGKRVRSVPLSDQALVTLDGLSRREHFTEPTDLVFCTETGGYLSDELIRDGFYEALTDAGLGHLRDKDDPIVPYDLRHTFGTLAVRTAPLTDVQAWMGHRDVTTTMRYVHYVPQHDAAAKLSAAFSPQSVHPDVHRTTDIRS